MRRRNFSAALGVLALGKAAAQSPAFPVRPLKLVVPWTPAGILDTLARLAAEPLGGALGQPVVVENRPGANGQIGYQSVLAAQPDGYTLLLINSGSSVLPMALGTSLPYNPVKNFTPIAQIAEFPLVIVARKDSPADSLHELLALSRARKGGFNVSVSAQGSISHLTAERLIGESATPMTVVTYKGESPSLSAVIAGEVDMGVVVNPVQFVRDKQLKALAVTGSTRWSLLPDVPTVIESGFPGFTATGWSGIAVAAGTPQRLIDTLARAAQSALASEQVRAQLRKRGTDPVSRTPAEFAALIQSEIDYYRNLVRRRNIKLESS